MTSFYDLRAIVLEEFQISKDEFNSPSPSRTIAMARAALVELAREHTDLSYPVIARLMKRHHTTLVTSQKRAGVMIQAVDRYRNAVSSMEARP